MLIYADDATLHCNINQNIGKWLNNAELLKLWEKFGGNKLSLNIAKTKYMVFHTSKGNVIYPKSKVNRHNLEMVTCGYITKLLFVVLLHFYTTWNKHCSDNS